MRRLAALLPLVTSLLLVACASSDPAGASGADAAIDAAAETDAASACAETLAGWCGRGGHVCVATLHEAVAAGSPYCGATFGVAWVHAGCAPYDVVVVGDHVDHATRYVYDVRTDALVAVVEQTTIVETCVAGAPGVVPPRGCDALGADPATCCRPSAAGAISCGSADAGGD